MRKEQIVIMNFTNVYRQEHFYEKFPHIWIDCEDIQGTYGYCDEQAVEQLENRVRNLPPEGIHFIDSGNYHYMSKIWIDKVKNPFSLIVFDHHPDMQPSLFENLLSCGCWVKAELDSNPFLKKVILIGAEDKLLVNMEKQYASRLSVYSQGDLLCRDGWDRFSKEHLDEAVYISIDKDVLCPKDAVTDWDQGQLRLIELKRLLHSIAKKESIVGIDICGEYPETIYRVGDIHKQEINDRANNEILQLILDEWDNQNEEIAVTLEDC